jgi:translation initiation factor IF-3
VISKMALREQHAKKLELARRQAKGMSGSGPAPKNLEFNWAIAGGDLKHRLGKLQEFLKEGRKVEIMLGPKNKGRKATEEEADRVMKAINAAVDGVKGASVVKSEGALAGVMMVTVQGWREKKKKTKQRPGDEGKDSEEGREESAVAEEDQGLRSLMETAARGSR